MINSERILRALDSHLDHEVSLVIFGRAAIALGFENPPQATAQTLDVDGISPVSQVAQFREDGNFWDAQQETNRELLKDGLYITHLLAIRPSTTDSNRPSICLVQSQWAGRDDSQKRPLPTV